VGGPGFQVGVAVSNGTTNRLEEYVGPADLATAEATDADFVGTDSSDVFELPLQAVSESVATTNVVAPMRVERRDRFMVLPPNVVGISSPTARGGRRVADSLEA
jgi:hypothetical protein